MKNIKVIYDEYKKYENEINGSSVITGEINIKSDDVGKEIQIINSYENYKRNFHFGKSEDDWKYENEKEIKENTLIKINGRAIGFSYVYKFEKEGIYQIEYIFKNNLTKTNHMFYGCKSLTNLNLSNFNTQNVTNMGGMFDDCNSLTNLNLSNFNTQNVTNMYGMFYVCDSLKKQNIITKDKKILNLFN